MNDEIREQLQLQLESEIQREEFMQSRFGKNKVDETVKVIKALSQDDWRLYEQRPGFFNLHNLMGTIKLNDRLAMLHTFQANENLRMALKPMEEITENDIIDVGERFVAFSGFSTRSIGGNERKQITRNVSEFVTTRTEPPKKPGFMQRFIPIRRNKQ